VSRLAADYCRGQLERSSSAVVREINPDIHRDAQADTGKREGKLPGASPVKAQRCAQ
jgi:hypothetical protein